MDYQICASCGGRGHNQGIICPRCDGMGRVQIPARLHPTRKDRRARG